MLVTSFLTSLLAGFLAGQREDGRDRLRRRAAAAVAGVLGLFVGFTLAGRMNVTGTEETVETLEE